jgi:hypothetical protein
MPVAIPRQRPYPLAGLDAECRKTVRHATRALREIPISIPVNVPFNTSRHDFLFTVMTIGVYEQRRYQ